MSVGNRRILQNKQKRCLAKASPDSKKQNKLLRANEIDPLSLFEEQHKKHKIQWKKFGAKLFIGFTLFLIKSLRLAASVMKTIKDPTHQQ